MSVKRTAAAHTRHAIFLVVASRDIAVGHQQAGSELAVKSLKSRPEGRSYERGSTRLIFREFHCSVSDCYDKPKQHLLFLLYLFFIRVGRRHALPKIFSISEREREKATLPHFSSLFKQGLIYINTQTQTHTHTYACMRKYRNTYTNAKD